MKSRFWSLLLILLSLVLGGCYSDIEDCLDPTATNFNPEADEDCCCKYPQVKTSLVFKSDTNSYSLGDTISHDLFEKMIIHDFAVLLQDFRLRSPTTEYEIEDMTAFSRALNGDTMKVLLKDDLILLRNRFNYTLGTLTAPDSLVELSFHGGLLNEYSGILSEGLDDDHPFEILINNDLWQPDTGYVVMHLEVSYGSDAENRKIIDFYETDWSLDHVLDIEVTKEPSTDVSINLDFDLHLWLRDIDFEASLLDIAPQLQTNFSDALKFRK